MGSDDWAVLDNGYSLSSLLAYLSDDWAVRDDGYSLPVITSGVFVGLPARALWRRSFALAPLPPVVS